MNNTYDDSTFFKKYSAMPRSVEGLEAAGEWPALRQMLPPLAGKRVLDLGCGFGWHCRYAADQGALEVVGVDLSANMLAQAIATTDQACIRYERAALEDVDFRPGAYDVVLSSLALHYVSAFDDVCRNIHKTLTPGGTFVFSVEHPVFTAQGPQDWFHDAQGQRAHWPVDSYFLEGPREATFLGERVRKVHRTLTSYVSGLLQAGFAIKGLVEPQPEPLLLETIEEMRDEVRRPMMLIIAAEAL